MGTWGSKGGSAGGPRALSRRRLAAAAVCAALGMAATVGDATAQWWPWGGGQEERRAPVPREPMRGPAPPPPNAPFEDSRGAGNICLQLEQRLVAETRGGGQGRNMLPEIEAEMRDLKRRMRLASIRLERSDCWDQFLFSKTLRRSRRCHQLNNEVEDARHRLADLDRQRRDLMDNNNNALEDEIIRELARNGCGEQYVREARKRDTVSNPLAMLFGGADEYEGPRGPTNQWGNLPFATYRTLCVRLCDGYYFPVSFSTLPNHFQRDAEVCQSQCAAPAELFYHRNPGGAVEEMVAFGSERPYTSLDAAFRYRKEFVRGCSCKQAEYNPGLLQKQADASAPSQSSPAAAPTGNVRIGAKR